MATLVSPGVSVSVIDQSQYATSGTGTVPLIILATKANKVGADGVTIAPGTKISNSLYLSTSQLDLTTQYGNAYFETINGTVQQGSEISEYGLKAAFDYLGLANRAYVIRADIDLAQLAYSETAPTSNPANGTYWFNLTTTSFGIFIANGNATPGLAWNAVTPLIPAASEVDGSFVPLTSFGANGNIAVVTLTTSNAVYQKVAGVWLLIGSSAWTAATSKTFTYAPHTQIPVGTNAGSIWIKTTNPNYGANYVVEIFKSTTNQFGIVTAPFYLNDAAATAGYAGALAIGSLYVQYNTNSNNTATQVIKRYNGSAWVVLSYTASTVAPTNAPIDGTLWINNALQVDIMVNNGNQWLGYLNMYPATDPNGVQITSAQPTTQSTGSPLADQDLWINSADVVNYPALYRYSANTSSWTLINKTDTTTPFGIVFADARQTDNGNNTGSTEITNMLTSNFVDPDAPNPETYPADILLFNTRYSTYNVKSYESTKFANQTPYTVGAFQGGANRAIGTTPSPTFSVGNQIIINGNTVTLTGTTLVQTIVDINNAAIANIIASDHNTFLEITNLANTTITISGNAATIAGMPATTAPVASISADRWVTASGNDTNGVAFFGRYAQHQMVVKAMASVIENNDDIRSDFNFFNLISAPGYPELISNLEALNIDRMETAFIITDTPMHLTASANSINNWATNAANVSITNDFGRTTEYTYSAEYYPQGLGTDSNGNSVAIPASSVALPVYAYNDSVAYPWVSPAGTQRGIVQNATSVGYVDPITNLFVPTTLSQGQRDVLYTNNINPITFLPNRGLIVYGDKTLEPGSNTALSRINVARLICYLRSDLNALAQPFLFQLNTETLRNTVESVFSRHLGDLLSLGAITDFAITCDTTNNTPERIDANELWIDIAVIPTKSINFIYIPIRIANTGTAL